MSPKTGAAAELLANAHKPARIVDAGIFFQELYKPGLHAKAE